MGQPDVQRVLRAGALNGESPVWSQAERRLYWVDVRAPALHRLDPETGEDRVWPMSAWIGCCALAEGGGVLAALRTGLCLLDTDTDELSRLAPPPYDPARFCFNDGGCDRQGRFHVGPMYAPLVPGEGGPKAAPMWRYDGSGRWTAATGSVQVSNGLAFSPDGRTLYHADTPRKTIWRLRYEPETGEARDPEVFATVEGGGDIGGPDGAAVDRDGFYLCAVFGGGCLLRFDPDGRLERRIAVPARYPTMPAFGGPDLSTLFVTSACFPVPEADRPARPDDGAVLALEAPCPGLPAVPFRTSADGTSA